MRCLMSIVLLLGSFELSAREIFISQSGSNSSGTGSLTAPYQTLLHVLEPANSIVQAGDLITLRGNGAQPAVYAANEYRLRTRLTLRSFPGEWAILRCPITVPDGICLQIDPDASGSVVSRLEIEGGTIYAVFLQTDWEQGPNPTGTGASNITLEDCKLHGSGRDVVKVTPKSNQLTIRRCEIYNSGRGYPSGTPLEDKNAEGIDNVNADGMRIIDSFIHNIATNCLYFKGGARGVIIERNRLENCGEGGIMVGFDTSPEFFDLSVNPGYFEAIGGVVRNNIIRNTDFAGIGLYASKDSLILNNTLIDTARLGHAGLYFGVTLQDFDPIAGRPANVNPRLVNNIVKQSHARCLSIRWANELGGLSGLSGTPGSNFNFYSRSAGTCLFSDGRPGAPLASGNLGQWRSAQGADNMSIEAPLTLAADGRLLANSAALALGQTQPSFSDDIDQQTRTAPWDIGADEFGLSDLILVDGFE